VEEFPNPLGDVLVSQFQPFLSARFVDLLLQDFVRAVVLNVRSGSERSDESDNTPAKGLLIGQKSRKEQDRGYLHNPARNTDV